MKIINKKYFITILGIIVFLIVVGLWYFQRNIFSKETLKLEILGPDTIEAGQEVDYVLKYKNNGDIALINPKLSFEYPENSLTDDNKKRVEKALEDIYPGEEKTLVFSGRIFGKEGELKKAQASIEFQLRNLKAKYEVSTSQSILIKFSPLTFELDLPSRLEAEKDFSFSLNYFSNIDYPLSQLRVKMEYPSSFEFIESRPVAIEQSEWSLPILNKAEGGRIVVSGRIKGEIGEQKTFKASLGMWQEGNFVPLKETVKAVEIVKPMVYLSQLVNGGLEYVAAPGEMLHYEIFFKNIGATPFENLFLVVNLDGELFDLETIRANNASYRAGDKTILWDWKKNSALRFLPENEEGKMEFWVEVRDAVLPTAGKNPVLKNSVDLSIVKEEFSIKVKTKLVLEQRAYFTNEAFGNSGPLPPQVGQATTFTITWKAKNVYNDVSDAKIKAVLPVGLSLTGQLLPRDAKFVFDSVSREIIWDVGDIVAGTGGNEPSFSFQVSLMPSAADRGQAAKIINTATVIATDDWTQESVSGQASEVMTTGLSDTGFDTNRGIVQ